MTRISESGRIAEANKASGVFLIRILDEGKGSSGIYTRELLESSGPKTFRKGTKMFIDHPKDKDAPWERSLSTLAGKLLEDAYVEERDGVVGLYAKAKADSRWAEFLTEYAEEIGVSIYAAADGHKNDDGDFVVEEFAEGDPYTSVDWVVAPGRNGGVDRVLEAYRAVESSIGNADESKAGVISAPGKEGKMEEVLAELKKLAESLAPVLAFVTESKGAAEKEVQAEADAEAIEAAVSEALSGFKEKISAIEAEADLLPSQKKALMESAERGEDITAQLEAAKAVAAEARQVVTEDAGVARGIVSGVSSTSAVELGKVLA